MTIISDSYSNLKNMEKYHTHVLPKNIRPDIIKDIKQLINSEKRITQLLWLPGHMGIPEMTQVDAIAKKAVIDSTSINISFPQSYLDIVPILEKDSKQTWENSLLGNSKLETYKQLTNFQCRNVTKLTNRKNEQTINRLRLDNCNLKAYRYKLNLETDPLCEVCKLPETVEHILLYCLKNVTLTKKLMLNLNKKYTSPPSIKNLLYNTDSIAIILDYFHLNNIQI